jgi:pyruvate/2-oxoglutarate dehydrogenase complex dihydrolipoamide dehydrogenase (E3) component
MTVAVVGAGLTGLRFAQLVAHQEPVVVVDRVPVIGGEAGYEDREVVRLAESARAAGVRLRLGATACRWAGDRLLVVGHDAIGWLAARHLVIATGLRPATAAELGLVGDRAAGVFPATVAKHLLETRAVTWRRPVIVGDSWWAPAIARQLHALGALVTAVVPRTARTPDWADDSRVGWDARTILGERRVSELVIADGERRTAIPCDVVILCADPRPIRNVEGAIADDASGVTYLQPTLHAGVDPDFDGLLEELRSEPQLMGAS